MRKLFALCGAASVLALATPAHAQPDNGDAAEIDMDNTVYAGDYLSIGVGAAVNPSYAGSNDYVISPLPIVQASIGGIDINPRGGGIGVDFIADPDNGPGFDLGVAARLRSDRATQVEDEVVLSLGELDRAIEVGPTAGVSFPAVLNPYDSLTVTTDVMWDINGAHEGMVVVPSVTYFTPLSRGMAASLSVNSEYADSDFHDYYFRVTPAQSVATGGVLPAFDPDGGGFTKVGATLLLGIDLNGDLTDGGLGLVAIAGYSRMLGDAKDTPFTSVRGSADQFLGAVGLGYTF